MKSIDSINNTKLYEELLKYNCKVSYNGKTIYEGTFNPDYKFDENVNKKCVVLEFDVNNKYALFTLENNEDINNLKALMEGKTFDIIKSDYKLFNKAMNIANNLPLLNLQFDESLNENDFRKYGVNYKKLYENFILLENDDKKDDKKTLERGEIKFTIWEKPDTRLNWLENNQKFQKIEYVYEDKEKGITIDFLLGKEDNEWKLWVGKVGATSYDDDPYCSFKTNDFAEAVVECLDKVEEMVADVKENPDNWVQFYVHI